MLYDVFICHASEDKDDFVRPLAEALRSQNVGVWYDEFSLSIGDSLRRGIERGLTSSRFGIVVLSPNFFGKSWSNQELSALLSRAMAENKSLILPIWHNVGRDDVMNHAPILVDLMAVSSKAGMESVVNELLKKIHPEESPLIVARNFLIHKGVTPPVITDEWWLDMIATEVDFLYPNLNHGWRWIFPLPHAEGSRGKQRGMNIAWTALQVDWARDGAERNICQITDPEIVQGFLREWPGLHECALKNPAILALYAPQLTIEGFDSEFSTAFDELMSAESIESTEAYRYGRAETIDGESPLCGDCIAWRHHSFGNYAPRELSLKFANAHDGIYSRHQFEYFDCLIWLLSNGADWMPTKLRQTLIQGFRDGAFTWVSLNGRMLNMAAEYRSGKKPTKFTYTKKIKEILIQECKNVIRELGLNDDPKKICSEFIDHDFIGRFLDESERRVNT